MMGERKYFNYTQNGNHDASSRKGNGKHSFVYIHEKCFLLGKVR